MIKALTPQKIVEITDGEYVGSEDQCNTHIKGAVRDNRDVKPGNLFICICGSRVDGHSFANSAFEAGAACCLTEQRIPDAKGPYVIVESTLKAVMMLGGYYRSLFNIPVIGITGSVGKTTTKELISAVLGVKFNVHKTLMNMNNELGVPLTLLSLDEKHEAAVIEMGINDFGEMSRLAEMVRPDIFVMTKIGYAHIKELGSLEGVLRAKTEAFAYMKPEGIAVMNGDDELLLGYDPKMRKITFGVNEHNDIRAENIQSKGIEFVELDIIVNRSVFQEKFSHYTKCDKLYSGRPNDKINTNKSYTEKFPIKIPAYGSHLTNLALAATAIGILLGLADKEISSGFLSYAPVDGRSNVKNPRGITLIDDCYNANPNSVEAALKSLSALTGRRLAILGDMLDLGENSEQMHREIGVFAASCGIDALICQGEHARFIYDGFTFAGGTAAHYYEHMTELINDIPQHIKKGDAVLVKASNGMHFNKLLPFISVIHYTN
jgi:UDP-N-acetylmuramoyl-tripeptide--D-alanyl-D-alanine ligase